jgi:hypothetical protein
VGAFSGMRYSAGSAAQPFSINSFCAVFAIIVQNDPLKVILDG